MQGLSVKGIGWLRRVLRDCYHGNQEGEVLSGYEYGDFCLDVGFRV
jgi:hypothetical protein